MFRVGWEWANGAGGRGIELNPPRVESRDRSGVQAKLFKLLALSFYCDCMRHNLWIGIAAISLLFSLPAAFAQNCDWTGTWETDWGTMELQQSGNTVTGTYTWDKGRIIGTAFENMLIGTWSEDAQENPYSPPDNAGDVEFTTDEYCYSFGGKWRYGSSGEWYTWTGHRVIPQNVTVNLENGEAGPVTSQ